MHFNIADLFESLVDVIPERPAAYCAGRRLTFAELDRRANQLAHSLLAHGVKAGDHIGLYLFNCTEFLEAMLAAFKIRAVPINVNYRYVNEELRYLFTAGDLVAVVHQREFVPRIADIRHSVPSLKLCISVEDGSTADLSAIGAIEYEALLAQGSPERGFAPRSPDDLYIIFTGGTTGMPRGVMWRHEDVFFAGLQGGNPGGPPIESPEQLAGVVLEGAPMNMLPAAPFIHGAAQWAAWISLFTGGKVVMAHGRSFDPHLILTLIGQEQVTTITMVGDAMIRPFGEAISASRAPDSGIQYDLSSLMVVVSAGAVLSTSVKEQVESQLPNAMVLNNFGATETGHQGTAFTTDSGPKTGPSFFMNENCTVLDDNGQPVVPGSGVIGRLARGGRIPVGYYKDPVKTAATFIELNGKRWAMPGDLATVEEDGMITVFGRGAVCINSGGEKIFGEEVEDALKAHPAVQDAVVIGVPDARWGERVAAVVQPRPGFEPTLEELSTHCRSRIAGYKVPRELHLVQEISRHPSGKPDYRWAKETANRQSVRQAQAS